MMDLLGLRDKLRQHHQEHLLSFWDELTDEQKILLYKDLSSIHFEEVSQVFRESVLSPDVVLKESLLEPLPKEVHESVVRSSDSTLTDYRNEGEFHLVGFVSIMT